MSQSLQAAFPTDDVTLAQAGDPDAFGRLVTYSANTVTSVVLAIVRDLATCEDLVQEVFLSAWANIKKLRNPQSFLPWLRQTARNRANTWLKEHIRERTLHTSTDDILAQAADPSLDPSHNMLAQEERNLLYRVIEGLPADAREVVILYYREGRSTSQVASLLDMREEAVRQRLTRARKQLRDDLLDRFGVAATKGATNSAIAVAVLSTINASTPAAIAGTAAAGKTVGTGLLGKVFLGAVPGALAGLLGVYLGLRREVKDSETVEERKALIRMGWMASIAVIATVAALSWTGISGQVWPSLIAYLGFSVVLVLLYGVRLPQITAGRRARELAADPSREAAHKRSARFKLFMMVLGLTTGWGTLLWALWMTRG